MATDSTGEPSGSSPATLRVAPIDRIDSFAALRHEWGDLLDQSRADCLYLTHDWLRLSWQFQRTGRPFLVVVRNPAGLLIGAAPLIHRRVWHRRLLPWRRLEVLGDGDADRQTAAYTDFPLRRGWERRAIIAILDYLVHRAPWTWDELALPGVPHESSTAPLLRESGPAFGLRVLEAGHRLAGRLLLPGFRNELASRLETSVRSRIDRCRSHLQRIGALDWWWSGTVADFQESWPILESFLRQNQGTRVDETARTFWKQVGLALAKRGDARVGIVRIDGQPIAATFACFHRDTMIRSLAGWNRELSAEGAWPALLDHWCCETAIDEGKHWFETSLDDGDAGFHQPPGRTLVHLRCIRQGLRATIRSAAGLMSRRLARFGSGHR